MKSPFFAKCEIFELFFFGRFDAFSYFCGMLWFKQLNRKIMNRNKKEAIFDRYLSPVIL
jgi:hypothetical protein